MTARPLPLQAYIPPIAVLGAMLFPQEEEEAERDGWEATNCAPILSTYRLQGGEVPAEMINWAIDHCGPRATDARDLRERWLGGTTVGELVKVMYWLTNEREDIASWEKAAEWLREFDRNTSSSSRRSVLSAKKRFSRVLHLWGAYCIRGRHMNDFHSFLAEAEFLRGWGCTWKRKAAKAEPLFGTHVVCSRRRAGRKVELFRTPPAEIAARMVALIGLCKIFPTTDSPV
jgi:hypothetical protein